MSESIYKEECYLIQGAVFEVYKEMGSGFLEAVYQECLEREFKNASIPFIAQKELAIRYKGELLSHYYKPDLICYGKIIVELKGISVIKKEHHAQVMNYLKATNLKLGLLINFGAYPKVEIIRIVL